MLDRSRPATVISPPGGLGLLDQQPHRGRLAGAAGADQEHELARLDRERDAVEADVAARVALGDVAEVDDRAARRQAGVGAGADAAARWRAGGRDVLWLPSATGEGTEHRFSRPGRNPASYGFAYRCARRMASIDSSSLANGLPIHRVEIPGTRALTVLVAFDAGARTERPEENGMAHFLEHLVFKGGEKYDDYRKVNETAERMGAVLNAYTSHDLVAFHITCRAEVAGEAIDLLTDFVGRPKIDAEELDRERGVVIQEIARSNDQPSVVAEHLIDRAAFGDHPLGRPVLGPEEHLRTFTREAIVAFRTRQWAGARGGAFLVGNLDSLPDDAELADAFCRFPSISANGGYEPAPAVLAADAGRGARLQPVAPADVLPARRRRRRHRAAAPR